MRKNKNIYQRLLYKNKAVIQITIIQKIKRRVEVTVAVVQIDLVMRLRLKNMIWEKILKWQKNIKKKSRQSMSKYKNQKLKMVQMSLMSNTKKLFMEYFLALSVSFKSRKLYFLVKEELHLRKLPKKWPLWNYVP